MFLLFLCGSATRRTHIKISKRVNNDFVCAGFILYIKCFLEVESLNSRVAHLCEGGYTFLVLKRYDGVGC